MLLRYPIRRPGRSVVPAPRTTRARLAVELLEDRNLLNATAMPGVEALKPGTYVPDHILVGDLVGQVQKIPISEGVSIEQALAAHRNLPGVAYAEPDYIVHLDLTPNDTYYGLEYGLHNTGQTVNGVVGTADADIDAPEAWNISTGSTRTVVSGIDTGIDYTHPDLYLNIWINQEEIPTAIRSALTDTDGDGLITFYDLNVAVNQGAGKITDLNANGRIDGGDLLNNASGWENAADNDADGRIDDLIGWDFVNNDNDPFDDNGHGTHTAGTIGAMTNNGVGVAGVSWNVQIAAMKFLNASGSGAISNAQAALDLSVANGILISNNSWGGGGYSSGFFNSLVNAASAGHVFVASAGNSSSNNDATPSYPASYNVANIIAVAATGSNDALASFSNYGVTSVDIAAPGVNTASTYPNNGYVYMSGTSMAGPHVAGVVALVRSQNPTMSYADVIGRILNGADVKSGLTTKVAGGRRLNAFGALNVGTPDVTGPRVTSAQPNSSTAVSSVRLTFNEAIDPASFSASDITNFTGAGSITGVAAVSGSGNLQFDVSFTTQTAPGSYSFDVGPDVRDGAGNQMDQNANGINGEGGDAYHVTFTVSSTFVFSNTTPVPIPDRATITSLITINQDIILSDVNVQLNITHTWDSDLYITLKSPAGKTVVLINRRGGSGDNFTNTILNDEASVTIASGVAPFSGSYRPEQLLSGFDGQNARGTWTLTVRDRATTDIGTLNSWSLTMASGGGGSGLSIGDFPSSASFEARPSFDFAFLFGGIRNSPSGVGMVSSETGISRMSQSPLPSTGAGRISTRAIDLLFVGGGGSSDSHSTSDADELGDPNPEWWLQDGNLGES